MVRINPSRHSGMSQWHRHQRWWAKTSVTVQTHSTSKRHSTSDPWSTDRKHRTSRRTRRNSHGVCSRSCASITVRRPCSAGHSSVTKWQMRSELSRTQTESASKCRSTNHSLREKDASFVTEEDRSSSNVSASSVEAAGPRSLTTRTDGLIVTKLHLTRMFDTTWTK